ncbi:outer membrane beta-barrel protein [Paraflavitalea pollutisoli]|uniref:outer membrane beta-barrel protein n=1 Tax=Paraflavitalea pollutisoli TaxID=3034143 RepID=UPI0023EC646F|nr:outer membrane beta-barrel protein [Paraflavitalea sp. H1-2-19X]
MNLFHEPILSFLLATAVPAFGWAQPALPDTAGKQPSAFLKDTLVFPRTDSMRSVTVTAIKNNLQVENGRITMNLANSALTAGASAFELLKRMPGVGVTQDDNISLRGSEGVQVLIDGKMNYLTGKQLADLLKGMSGDNIVRIELLTTPTANYDAAGNAGIINIVTRKRTTRGYAVDLRTTVTRGSTWMHNENISASVNTGTWSLYGSFDYNTPNRQVNSTSGNTIPENGTSLRLHRQNTSRYLIKFYTGRAGIDYQLNKHHQLSAHYHGYFDDFTAPKDALVYRYGPDQQVHSTVRTTTNIVEPYHYDAANLAWTWWLDTTGKKLTTEAHYISYRNLSDALMTSTLTSGIDGALLEKNALRTHQPGYITIRSAKADLEWPTPTILWKAGLKYAGVTNDNHYRFDSLINDRYEEASSMSNHFLYEERVAAAYVSAFKKIQRTSFVAGLRIEHTDAKGQTLKDGNFNRWQYTSLFPSLSIDQELHDHKLSLSLSRRINRPAYADLNPVRWYTDQYFYYAGNPSLVPEMAWLLSAAWTVHRKYILTASYALRENYLTKRLTMDSSANAVKSQTANFRNLQRFDLLVSAPFSAGPWSLQLNAGINHSRYPLSQLSGETTLARWSANVQLQQQLRLPAGFRAELAAYYYSSELWGIYLKRPLYYVDAGLRKNFGQDKLTAQISLTDIFRTYRLRGTSLSNTTDYWYNDRPEAHRISLSLQYRIGGKLTTRKATQLEEQERL